MKQILLIGILFSALIFSCKKENAEKPTDYSGSLLDTKIDTIWTAPNGSTANIKIVTYKGPKSTLYNDERTVYNADVHTKLVSGSIKAIKFKLKYRHFPKDYSEYEPSTESTYPVKEETYSSFIIEPSSFPLVSVYRFIPDPGPIDRIEITLWD